MKVKIIRETGLRKSMFLIGVLLHFLSLPTNAQDDLKSTTQKLPGEAPSIRFEQLGLEDGLQQGTVYEIMQDRQGYLWMTTQDGLHRYDGYEFKVFSNTPFDTTSIASGIQTSVEETSDGDIWIVLDGKGLQRMDRSTETFSSYRHNPKDSTSLSSDFTWDLKEGQNGDFWVSTVEAGLNQMLSGEDGKFRHFRHDPEDAGSLTSDIVFWVEEDQEGMIWVGSMNGTNRIDPETGTVERFLYDPDRAEIFYGNYSVLDHYFPPGKPDIVWLATGRGLVRLDVKTGSHERFVIDEKKGPS